MAGPALAVTRTYNSQDPRTSGAFGAGWSTPFDQRVDLDPRRVGQCGGHVADRVAGPVRAEPRRQLSPRRRGMNLTLVYTASPASWTLRDRTGYRRSLRRHGPDHQCRPTSDGRTQTYTYAAGKLTTVTDVASGRALHLTWTGSHVTTVATDVPAVGQPAPAWTYGYSGDFLTSACTPLPGTPCTTYAPVSSSQYRSLVVDDNPAGYWPLGGDDRAGRRVTTSPVR